MPAEPGRSREWCRGSRWISAGPCRQKGSSSRSSVKPRIAVKGVRSSWLTLERNSLLARLACSAASLARRMVSACSRRFSMRFCSVISRVMARIRPWGSFANPGDEQVLAIQIITAPASGSAARNAAVSRPVGARSCQCSGGREIVGVNRAHRIGTADPVASAPACDDLEGWAERNQNALIVDLPDDHASARDQAVVSCLDLLEGFLGPLAVADVAGDDQSQRLGLGVDPADADVHRQGVSLLSVAAGILRGNERNRCESVPAQARRSWWGQR